MYFYNVTTLLTLATTMFLGGCSHQLGQEWMPRGYANNSITPISTPTKAEPWNHWAQIKDTENMSTNTVAWQGAVFEMLDKLRPSLPMDGSALYIKTVDNPTSTDLAFDHYLRQALLQKGMTLTSTPGNGLTLMYKSEPMTGRYANLKAAKAAGYVPARGENLKDLCLLTATIMDQNGKNVATAASIATIPFERAAHLHTNSGISVNSATTTSSTLDRQ